MPSRPSWKGHLRLSLVTVPVKAFTASNSSSGEVRLNQLHNECNSRIQYKKTCPIHGEISTAEIVSGYEYSKGQYVVIDPDELDQLRTKSDKAISINAFVSSDEIDPLYHAGRTYYLLPSEPIGQKPYSLIVQAMEDEGQVAIAQVVISSREQLVMLRPMGRLLMMTLLSHQTKVKAPIDFEEELADVECSTEEVELTKSLVKGLVKDDFEYSSYEDSYVTKLKQLIEARVEGKELVSPDGSEEPEVINLMDALKASVERVKEAEPVRPTKKKTTKKKTAPKMTSAARKTTKKKTKKKTG
ncbi:MAG: Ku protein [Planctomycetaceae bacterium]